MKSIAALVVAMTMAMACAANAADLSGLWVGYYSYNDRQMGEPVECSMVVEQVGDEFYAWMIERQTFGPEPQVGLLAMVVGDVAGNNVSVVKVYEHDQEGPGVPYQLTASKDGNTLSGNWQTGGIAGKAVFKRITPRAVERIKP